MTMTKKFCIIAVFVIVSIGMVCLLTSSHEKGTLIIPKNKGIGIKDSEVTEGVGIELGLILPNKFVHVPIEQIAGWKQALSNNRDVVEQQINTYLEGLNDQYASQHQLVKFPSTYQNVVQLPLQSFGWRIETKAALKQLVSVIERSESVVMKLPLIGYPSFEETRDFQWQDYVEIDLKYQMLLIYKNQELVFATPIVSGHPDTPTEPGIYRIWQKSENAILKGKHPFTQTLYEIKVDYWVAIDSQGLGIHDAEWLSFFGGEYYQRFGSLGCINVATSQMKCVFALIEEGMPVIILPHS